MFIDIDAYLRQILHHLGMIYLKFTDASGQVAFVGDKSNQPHFRYTNKSASLLCYLKGIKSISTLNACMLLLEHGYTQEIGALCRMVDDFINEIIFILGLQDGGELTTDQIRFVENFFQEEFDKPGNPLASTQKRETVNVKKIHATVAKRVQQEVNPSDMQEMLRTTHQSFSGFIHGAYPHIMEMYGGKPPTFHLTGMLGTRRIQEWRDQLIGYVYRLLMVSVLIAQELKIDCMQQSLRELLANFEKTTGSKPQINAATMLATLKKNAT